MKNNKEIEELAKLISNKSFLVEKKEQKAEDEDTEEDSEPKNKPKQEEDKISLSAGSDVPITPSGMVLPPETGRRGAQTGPLTLRATTPRPTAPETTSISRGGLNDPNVFTASSINQAFMGMGAGTSVRMGLLNRVAPRIPGMPMALAASYDPFANTDHSKSFISENLSKRVLKILKRKEHQPTLEQIRNETMGY